MLLPNLIASRRGRLIAFFFLYMTEGIPLGFTSTTMAVQMKRAGIGEKAIGIFVASLYLPWAWKWLMGPIVDLVYSNRLGARRGWILGTQIMMVLTLLICMPIELSSDNLKLITLLILIHNLFCATQDVAIDALACNVLSEKERGLANGLMFAGQTLGVPLGGACVLYLIEGIDLWWLPALRDGIPVQSAYWFVIACILLVTTLVVIPMRETPHERRDNSRGPLQTIKTEIVSYLTTTWRSFVGKPIARYGLLFALLPAGANGLNLALQKTVAVEIGFSDGDIADLEVASSILWAVMCVLGGIISDRLGHLKCLAVFLALISIPTFWCAYRMQQENVILPRHMHSRQAANSTIAKIEEPSSTVSTNTVNNQPIDEIGDDSTKGNTRQPGIFQGNQIPPMAHSFWWAVMIYMAFQGLMYGTRTAIFMRIANPDVAATQFTAYMAMMNLVISYTAWWQGYTIEKYGYPTTLYLDAILGLVCIAILPMLYDKSRPTA